jgi:ABC-type thiamine transport system ATPase subunit
VHPDGGTVLIDGRDIGAVPPQKRGFGMVFQNYAIFPHLNVFENIAFSLCARHWTKDAIGARMTWALELVRLSRFAERDARQLSGGLLFIRPERGEIVPAAPRQATPALSIRCNSATLRPSISVLR